MCSPKSKSRDEDGNPNKTHLKVFRAEEIKNQVGLTKEGMILLALLSGGDYDTTVSIGAYFLNTVINNPFHLLGSQRNRSESCSWFGQMWVW